jgi:hypothetical protein
LYEGLGLTGSIRVRFMFVYEDFMCDFLVLNVISLMPKASPHFGSVAGTELVTSRWPLRGEERSY